MALVIFGEYLDNEDVTSTAWMAMGISIATPILYGLLTSLYGAIQQTQYKKRLIPFLQANNIQYIFNSAYSKVASSRKFSGTLFLAGNKDKVFDEYFNLGTDANLVAGNYSYTVETSKNSETSSFGFFSFKLTRKLPHIILDASHNNKFLIDSLGDRLVRNQASELEGDFYKHFTVYAPELYQTDMLYILTPDVMASLVDFGKQFDIEIVDDYVFFYSSEKFDFSEPNVWEGILNASKEIFPELQHQTKYYADSNVKNRALNKVADQGRRLKSDFFASKTALQIFSVLLALNVLLVIVLLLFIYGPWTDGDTSDLVFWLWFQGLYTAGNVCILAGALIGYSKK